MFRSWLKLKKGKTSVAGMDDKHKPNVRWFPIAHKIVHRVVAN